MPITVLGDEGRKENKKMRPNASLHRSLQSYKGRNKGRRKHGGGEGALSSLSLFKYIFLFKNIYLIFRTSSSPRLSLSSFTFHLMKANVVLPEGS